MQEGGMTEDKEQEKIEYYSQSKRREENKRQGMMEKRATHDAERCEHSEQRFTNDKLWEETMQAEQSNQTTRGHDDL